MANAYVGFNRPSGKPNKVAGGSHIIKQGYKGVNHSNEQAMPGQTAGAMAPMGSRGYGNGESAATDTGTVRKAK